MAAGFDSNAKVMILCKERDQRLSRSSIGSHLSVLDDKPSLMSKIINEESEALNETPTVLSFKNDNIYEGDIENNFLNGKGKYKWSNGTIYEGDFKSNTLNGVGSYFWIDGSWYNGEVSCGLRNGYGTYQCPNNGPVYTGQWVNGQRHGKGKITFNSQEDSFYDGEWSNDKQCGMGIRQYSSGNVYNGQWKEGQRHGKGTMHWKDKNEQYTGDWINGIQHGVGEYIWQVQQIDNSQYPQSNCYVGDWDNGIRQGYGTFYYASGSSYEGQWLDNKKHGEGKYTLPNGKVIKGLFQCDKLVNEYSDPSGRPITPLGSVIGDIDNECVGSITEKFNFHVSLLLPSDSALDSQLKELHCSILRHLTLLRKIYHFYSTLGQLTAVKNKLLKRMQLWQFMKDCELHQYHFTLFQADVVTQRAHGECNGHHNPMDEFLMREFLQCLVFLAYYIYKKDNNCSKLASCFDKFMKQDCLPKACKLQGLYFSSTEITSAIAPYTKICWELYLHTFDQKRPTLRHFLLYIKEFVHKQMSAKEMVSVLVTLQPLAVDSEENEYNLDIPMVFLEFMEGLLYFAKHWIQRQRTEEKGDSNIITSTTEAEQNEEMKDVGNGDGELVVDELQELLGENEMKTTEDKKETVEEETKLTTDEDETSPEDIRSSSMQSDDKHDNDDSNINWSQAIAYFMEHFTR